MYEGGTSFSSAVMLSMTLVLCCVSLKLEMICYTATAVARDIQNAQQRAQMTNGKIHYLGLDEAQS